MNGNTFNLLLGLTLILLGSFMLWYANAHPDFYTERRWERWRWRAALLGLLFRLIFRIGGSESVRWAFRLFALICIGVGIWAMIAT
ncbi:MAG: hypothetical protein PSW75_10805 [bacterium]|nr:hypothetical protein [bacterium]MDI1336256.1 hypothetical protein [Lacunisphaera sp.]